MKIKKYKRITESAKPKMISDIEQMFGLGSHTWDEGPNFTPNNVNIIGMFDIINKYIFENKLDRSVRKIVKEPEKEIDRKALATCAIGKNKNMPEGLYIMRNSLTTNFFITFSSMIHEMIHYYDFMFGPMGAMIRKCEYTGQLNWGAAYNKSELDNLRNAGLQFKRPDGGVIATGLRKDQLPDGMPDYSASAKQFQYPEFNPAAKDYVANIMEMPLAPRLKMEMLKHRALHPKKYELSDVSMYDVHGRYFKRFAQIANYVGFDISETFGPLSQRTLRRTWESEQPSNVVDMLISKLKSNQYVGGKFIDDGNWFIEIQ